MPIRARGTGAAEGPRGTIIGELLGYTVLEDARLRRLSRHPSDADQTFAQLIKEYRGRNTDDEDV
jgi:hypothetical protein